MKRFYLAMLCVVLSLLGLITPALAQAVLDNAVDFSPVVNHVFTALGILLTGLASALVALALRWVNAKTGMVNASTQIVLQKTFDTQMANMMAAAEAVAKSYIPKDGKIEIDNPFFRAAVKFGLEHYPETIGKMSPEAILSSMRARFPTGELTEKADAIREASAAAAPAAA
jgi:hypothetical protein